MAVSLYQPGDHLKSRPIQAGLVVAVICLLLGSSIPAQEALPGNPGRIAYERGMLEWLRGNREQSLQELELALGQGDSYGDLARIMLLRLKARDTKPDPESQLDPQLLQLISGFEDQKLMPVAWHAILQALVDLNRREAALRHAQEFAARFPEHELLDDSLLLAAQLLYQNREYAAALEILLRLFRQAPQDANRLDEARLLWAHIYLAAWPQRSPGRSCSILAQLDQKSSLAKSSQGAAIRDLYQVHCDPL